MQESCGGVRRRPVGRAAQPSRHKTSSQMNNLRTLDASQTFTKQIHSEDLVEEHPRGPRLTFGVGDRLRGREVWEKGGAGND